MAKESSGLKYFAKYVTAAQDAAISEDFDKELFKPFTLLAIHGFGVSLNTVYAAFFMALVREMCRGKVELLVSRISDCGQNAFDVSMSKIGRIEPSPCRGLKMRLSCDSRTFVVSSTESDELAKIISKNWETGGGNWFLTDLAPNDNDFKELGATELPAVRNIHELRAMTFPRRSVSCTTFDDKLLDCYIHADLDDVIETVSRLAGERDIVLERVQG